MKIKDACDETSWTHAVRRLSDMAHATSLQVLHASKIRGVRLAIVVDNKDGDGNPGYRVKLKLPWLNEHETTFWARIAIPMSGADRGTYVLPEIDDQVLVVFEHGDIGRPIVIGALWSRNQEPVEVNQSGKNNTKLIKSRSGHRIIFDDKDGAEKITIVDKTRKNKIVLDSVSKIVKLESDGDLEVIAKANVIVHANALKIGTTEGVTGRARSLLTHAQKTFGLKATSGITIGGGTTTINTSSSAACSVSGAGAGELHEAGAETPKDPVAETTRQAAGAPGGHRGAGGSESAPSPAAASAVQAASRSTRLTFVELKVVDGDGRPVPFVRYRVTGSDGATFSGAVDASGRARIDGIPEGVCQVSFPDLHGDDWSAG
jgi:phage baseplate assembly protein gpV